MYTEISNDTHHSVNADNSHNACDTGDEDPRPAKRRKPRLAPVVTLPLYLRKSPSPPPTTRAEIDETQSQVDPGCPSTFVEEQHCVSQTSRSPSVALEAGAVAEYQEWPFQGFLKHTRIGDDVTYNLEFKLPSISHLQLPIHPDALDIFPSKEGRAKVPITHDATAHSKMHQAPPQPEKRRVKWTSEEEATLLQMRNDGCSWEKIHAALPHRSIGTIQADRRRQQLLRWHWAPASEKDEPSSSDDDDDSSNGDPDFSSDNGDSSEAEQSRTSSAC